MANNREKRDAWLEAEDTRNRRQSVWELNVEGYEHYTHSGYCRAASLFCQAAEMAAEQEDVDEQCNNLLWAGYCYSLMGKLKTALARLLLANQLGGGTASVRFNIVSELFDIASQLLLTKEEQTELLHQLSPYKASEQFGGSKSKCCSGKVCFSYISETIPLRLTMRKRLLYVMRGLRLLTTIATITEHWWSSIAKMI